MKRPTPPPVELRDLIAVCLELYESRGAGAVDAVLREHPDSADIVRERLDFLGRAGLIGRTAEESLPERVGDYRVIGVLGRGGMGVVYEAEQAQPRRRVALKVLRSWPGEQALGRFRHEAELLARLQHPGIAAVHEAGTAVVGGVTVPFFAMELVRGRSLDAYAAEEGLDTRARAALVAKVADAVHHAHQKGVVHRDLKPANVIVDERGEPRVLDFGVARAIDPDLKFETLWTEVGQLVGTLAYMSPEQAAGDPDQVDSRTDVYALGAVAFQLFSGRLPHEVDGRPVLEVLQAIRDEEPPRLGELDRSLRGDLETIVATALALDKERRYPSADALAADLRRYLRHEPITARPATAVYQLTRLARRHRALVGASAAVLVALVLGLAGTLVGFLRAAEQRDEAERRFRLSNVVSSFHTRMFATADPSGAGIRVEDLLRRAAAMVGPPGEDPLETAVVQLAIGEAFAGIGAYSEAETFLALALQTFERELGPADLQSLAARTRWVTFLTDVGRLDEAEAALDGLVEAAALAHGAGHDTTLDARLAHASLSLQRGRPEEAAKVCADVLSAPGGDAFRGKAKGFLAAALVRQGDHAAAAEAARDAYEWSVAELGPRHLGTLRALQNLGLVLLEAGRTDEGGALLEELLAVLRDVLGDAHPDTLRAMVTLFPLYYARMENERGEALLREVLERGSRDLPPSHPTLQVARGHLAVALIGLDRPAEAEELLRRTLEVEGKEPGGSDTLMTLSNLGLAVRKQGRMEEAAELYHRVLEGTRRTHGDRHGATVLACLNLGQLYRQRGAHGKADPYLAEAARTATETFDERDYRTAFIVSRYALNLGELGRFEEAEAALARAESFAVRQDEGHPVRGLVREAREEVEARVREGDR